MGQRKITIRKSVAESIARAAWFIESKGLVVTAEKFSNAAYDFIETLADRQISHPICRDPSRSLLGFKCKSFHKKYTVVFLETEQEITICEFVPSKLIHW